MQITVHQIEFFLFSFFIKHILFLEIKILKSFKAHNSNRLKMIKIENFIEHLNFFIDR